MNGILLIDKPAGWTSFDVVAKVRGLLRQSISQSAKEPNSEKTEGLKDFRATGLVKRKLRVGHAGTLDPLATGLLVILIGNYCKRASEFSKLDKVYEATMKLGVTSTTGDEEGKKTDVSSIKPTKIIIKNAIASFIGIVEQTPPAYSAIKINGQRAYKLARAGKEVVIEPRKVTIYSITDVEYDYPEVKFTTKVSSGTYIRSLVEDIGRELGTGAYMTALRRTQIGEFDIADSQPPTEVDFSNMLTEVTK